MTVSLPADKLVCVVIPVYKALSAYDVEALAMYRRVFSRRDIWCAMPSSLDAQTRDVLKGSFGFRLKDFDSSFFKSVDSYSRLLTLPLFYRAFGDYQYMLIAQLDAVCFRDDLDSWCGKGYDYVGAPWCHLCRHVCNPCMSRPSEKLVGNGGLSLRRIDAFVRQLPEDGLRDFVPEDLKIMQYLDLKTPRCDEALHFSVESYANVHVLKNNIKAMGMHQIRKIYPWLYQ